MRAAIFSEGRSDHAVIKNILKGKLDIDASEIRFDTPEYDLDQTDLHTLEEEQFGSWTLVKQECSSKERIRTFLDAFEQDRFIVIQIDSAERHLNGYEVLQPTKTTKTDDEYSIACRENIVEKIREWLNDEPIHSRSAYAVTIEEIEAWLLTIHEPQFRYDPCRYNDPKNRLFNVLNRNLSPKIRKQVLTAKSFQKYDYLSVPFRKPKALKALQDKCLTLKLFCDSLEAFNIP